MRAFRTLSICLLGTLMAASVSQAQISEISVNGRRIVIEGRYQSPTPAELSLAAPFRAELDLWYERSKAAKDPLRAIREADKRLEDAPEGQKAQYERELERAKNNPDPLYQSYLDAERALNAAIGRQLQGMSQRERLLNPLMNSYVRVVPYISARVNTVPKDLGVLDEYRSTYESKRSTSPRGSEMFMQWTAGQDPSFEELNGLLALMERHEGFMPGFLHAIAWRESLGNPQEGAMNADERGLFQIQSTDYQPEFGVPLDEPAGSLWSEFERYCRWIPYNVAIAAHSYERLMKQAEEYGFTGDDRMELAYRFYNESSGYILFCQERLKIYRQLFGISPSELHENDIDTLNRFIYFQKEDLMQMYDWQMPDGTIAGEALWNAWRNARIEVTSDLVWKVLLRRLIEQKQYFTLSVDEAGRRWCTADMTMQNIKRRGSPGIPGLMMTAIGICSARGVVPTARIMEAYFYGPDPTASLTVKSLPAPIPNQPPAVVPEEAKLVQLAAGMMPAAAEQAMPAAVEPVVTPQVEAAVAPQQAAPVATPVEAVVSTAQALPILEPSVQATPVETPAVAPAALTPTPRFTPVAAPSASVEFSPMPVQVTPLPAISLEPQAAPVATPEVITATPAEVVVTSAPTAIVVTPEAAVPAVVVPAQEATVFETPAPASQPAMVFRSQAAPPPVNEPVEALPVQ